MAQSFKLQQPQDKVVVTAGEMINLTCTVSGETSIIGPVSWLKGWGSGNRTVYADTGSFPRVTRAVNSDTDFSISISNAQPEDSGTYYCVKFRRSVTDEVAEVFQHGKGTEVSLRGSALVPSMVAAAVLLFLLLVLCTVFYMYRRKCRDKAKRPCPASPAAVRNFSPMPKRCETNGTPSNKVLDAETSHQPSQQHSKEDSDIQYADLQLLPQAAGHGRSPGTACSEYASVMVAAK